MERQALGEGVRMTAKMMTANGIQQCYEITGPEGAPWVTLAHGSGDNRNSWWLQVPALAETYRVLTYDVRGHGDTETPEDASMGQMTFVDDLVGLLDALDIRRTALIGYSMGGGIVRNMAATHPSRVWSLVISNGGRLDPPAPASQEEADAARAMREERVAGIRSGGMNFVFDGWLAQVYTPEFLVARPEIVEAHRAVMTANDPDKYIRVMSGMGGSAGVDLAAITAPTLIVVGAGDQYTGPEAAGELAQELTGTQAAVEVFPTRHGTPFERHEEYNRTLLDHLNANRAWA